MNENKTIPTVLITGASGFIGSHLVRFLSPNHRVIAFARRTQKEVGLEAHPNIHWILVDITDEQKFETAFNKANDETNIDFIVDNGNVSEVVKTSKYIAGGDQIIK